METTLVMSKIVDISAARLRRSRQEITMSTTHLEKRKEFRHPREGRLFVQIVKAEDEEIIGTTISCDLVEVSASGLRIQTNTPIPVGCQLDLWVDNTLGPGKFFLSSDVRWTQAVDGTYQAGVSLHDGPATDIEVWRQVQG